MSAVGMGKGCPGKPRIACDIPYKPLTINTGNHKLCELEGQNFHNKFQKIYNHILLNFIWILIYAT